MDHPFSRLRRLLGFFTRPSRRSVLRQLYRMNDHMLDDMGLDRHTLERALAGGRLTS